MVFSKTAYDVWKEEKNTPSIITLCKDLDQAIGDGIKRGVITELVGAPGSGKTQLCLQLCVNVQIPKNLHGLGGAAVYIDTNRGYTINRIRDMARASQVYIESIYKERKVPFNSNTFNEATILDNVHLSFCDNHVELMATIFNLRDLLISNPKIRLIVIDSFSYLFRSADIDETKDSRLRILCELFKVLRQLAENFKCAVVITNELTTRFTADDEPELIPALGDTHPHCNNFQISLGYDENYNLYVANVDKSFCNAEKLVQFRITQDGVRPVRTKKAEKS